MKEKDLLKVLKSEVTSIMPNCYDKVNNMAVKVEPNREIKATKSDKQQLHARSKFIVAVACSMVLVFALMVAMPFIINSRTNNSSNVQQIEEETSE